jgi:UDPglucose 6-dehydrogenase
MKHDIGIIGNGFVGGAVAFGFKEYEPLIYDINPEVSKNTFDEVANCKYLFVCLPTPRVSEIGGEANLCIVNDCLQRLSMKKNKDQVILLKSTVPVGVTKELAKTYNLKNLIHCPEFLTAANANHDFVNADRTIIGSPYFTDSEGLKYSEMAKELFLKVFPNIPVYTMSSCESEMVKYTANCFLATKVGFFNMIFMLGEKLGLDYDRVLSGVLSDPRVGASHTSVPGPDGDFGFGGTCFPKDVNAMIKTLDKHGISSSILESVWEDNMRYRSDWDWAKNESAVRANETQ